MEGIGAELEVMKRVPLADEHVAAMREIGEERDYAQGDMVAEVGQPMDRFVYVLEGEIEVVDPYSGERLLDASLGPTQFMGELSFLNAGNNYIPMRAAKPTRTLEVERTAMLDLMARVPELSDHVLTVFSARRRRQFEFHNSAIKLIGADQSAQVRHVESFLSRNRIPFQSFDLEDRSEEATELCDLSGHEPAVIFNRDQIIEDPTPRKIARLLILDLGVAAERNVDLPIVGGGPAGVAAAVYAGAEGLSALLIEDLAVGGQAGTSSRIENFMGFPTGISGADLVYRGQIQALKFGTRFVMPRRIVGLRQNPDSIFCATLDDGDELCARAVLVATGVQYRSLPLEGIERFEGAGIFYAATEMEARFCRNTDAVVVGGGNSAGQAAMHLSRHARAVHVLVRGKDLSATMSDYLARRLRADPRVHLHFGASIAELRGDNHLDEIVVRDSEGERVIATRALFIMIGAAPNTEWLSDQVKLDDKGFVLTGAEVGKASPFATSQDGVFAVGDVRASSVKRVASAVGEGSVVVSAIFDHVDRSRRKNGG